MGGGGHFLCSCVCVADVCLFRFGPQHPDNRGGTRGVLDKLKEKCTTSNCSFLRIYGIGYLPRQFGLRKTDILCSVRAKQQEMRSNALTHSTFNNRVHLLSYRRQERSACMSGGSGMCTPPRGFFTASPVFLHTVVKELHTLGITKKKKIRSSKNSKFLLICIYRG